MRCARRLKSSTTTQQGPACSNLNGPGHASPPRPPGCARRRHMRRGSNEGSKQGPPGHQNLGRPGLLLLGLERLALPRAVRAAWAGRQAAYYSPRPAFEGCQAARLFPEVFVCLSALSSPTKCEPVSAGTCTCTLCSQMQEHPPANSGVQTRYWNTALGQPGTPCPMHQRPSMDPSCLPRSARAAPSAAHTPAVGSRPLSRSPSTLHSRAVP